MKPTRLWVLAALPLALAACGGGDEEAAGGGADSVGTALPSADSGATTVAPTTTDTSMAAQPMAGTVALNAVGGSGVTGQASFMEHGAAQTMVTVNLAGQGSGTHAGHIHTGTCDNIGPPVAPLQPVTLANGTGTATSTVEIALATVMNGQHLVSYHQSSGDNPGPPIACGQIQAQQGGAAGSPPPAM